MIIRSHSFKMIAALALVTMAVAGLASCGGGGSGSVGRRGDQMTILPGPGPGPNLAVVAFFLASGVHDGAPGRSLTFQGRIRNVGNEVSPATTLRFYRSRNQTIATDGTFLGMVALGTIAASSRIDSETLTLTAPSAAGTYYYGACVDAVTDESDTTNNCSDARPITVDGPPPDLVVTGPNVSEIGVNGRFLLIVTVGNQGAGGGRGDNGAVQTLDGRDDHDLRHDRGHGRGEHAFPYEQLRGNDPADGAIDAWHVLLRRMRGCGDRRVRHHQQLLVGRESGRELKPLKQLVRA